MRLAGASAQMSVGACVVTLFLSLDQSHVPAGASMTPTANIGVSIRSTESSIFACEADAEGEQDGGSRRRREGGDARLFQGSILEHGLEFRGVHVPSARHLLVQT